MAIRDEVRKVRSLTSKQIMGISGSEAEAIAVWKSIVDSDDADNIFTICGDVSSYAIKPGKGGGENILLQGVFLGRNNCTGQICKSTKCFLPSKSDAQDLLAMFKTARESDPQAVIGFSYDYSVLKNTKSVTGYSFDGEPEKTAAIITREAELLGRMKALPEPSKKK